MKSLGWLRGCVAFAFGCLLLPAGVQGAPGAGSISGLGSDGANGIVANGKAAAAPEVAKDESSSSDQASLGSELLASSGWTSTGWTGSWTAGWANGASNTSVLSFPLTGLSTSAMYQVSTIVTGQSAGSVDVYLNGTELAPAGTIGIANQTYLYTPFPGTTSGVVSWTPTSNFNGTLILSVKEITPVPDSAALTAEDSTGAANAQIWGYLAVNGNIVVGTGGRYDYAPLGPGSQNPGLYNVFMGQGAGLYNTLGSYNAAFGWDALLGNQVGFRNTALGNEALTYNTIGQNNTAAGQGALYQNVSGSNNTATGNDALQANSTGSQNTADGQNALYANTYGFANVAIGNSSQGGGSGGSFNTAVGQYSLYYLNYSNVDAPASGNTAVGHFAGLGVTTGQENVFVGDTAGYGCYSFPSCSDMVTTGSFDTFIGEQSGQAASTPVNDSFAVGSNATVTHSNEGVLGDNNTTVINMGGEDAGAQVNAGSLNTSNITLVILNGTPTAPTGTPSTSGGTMTADTTYAIISGLNCVGMPGTPSVASSGVVTTGSTASIVWTWPAMSGVCSISGRAQYRISFCAVSHSACSPVYPGFAWYYTSTTNSFTQIYPANGYTGGYLPQTNQTGSIDIGGSMSLGGSPSIAAVHGTVATALQGSDGTGPSGHIPKFAPDGSLTDGYAPSSFLSGATGTVTSASGTVTSAHTFSTAFTATPVCTASAYSNAGAWYFSTLPSTTSTGVITYATSGAQTFSVQCIGSGGAW